MKIQVKINQTSKDLESSKRCLKSHSRFPFDDPSRFVAEKKRSSNFVDVRHPECKPLFKLFRICSGYRYSRTHFPGWANVFGRSSRINWLLSWGKVTVRQGLFLRSKENMKRAILNDVRQNLTTFEPLYAPLISFHNIKVCPKPLLCDVIYAYPGTRGACLPRIRCLRSLDYCLIAKESKHSLYRNLLLFL